MKDALFVIGFFAMAMSIPISFVAFCVATDERFDRHGGKAARDDWGFSSTACLLVACVAQFGGLALVVFHARIVSFFA